MSAQITEEQWSSASIPETSLPLIARQGSHGTSVYSCLLWNIDQCFSIRSYSRAKATKLQLRLLGLEARRRWIHTWTQLAHCRAQMPARAAGRSGEGRLSSELVNTVLPLSSVLPTGLMPAFILGRESATKVSSVPKAPGKSEPESANLTSGSVLVP